MRYSIVFVCLLTAAPAIAQETAGTKKILFSGPAELARELATASPKARIVPVTDETVMREIVDADAFIGAITPAQVRAGKKLRWVQTMSAGVEGVLHMSGGNDLRDSDIILTNDKIVQGPEIADHAMALLLMLSRNLYAFYDAKSREQWRGSADPGIELNGKTAIVVGLGGIGTQIAVRANAFGMKIIAVDPEDKPFLPFVQRTVKPDQLDAVLPEADVVFISAPHTPQSYKMMGARQFELMKKGSYFVAVSRGAIYDMNGLVKALDSKRLAGAGVDVTDPEPLPAGHPLWKFPNALITPHVAGQSDRIMERIAANVRANIQRFVDGRPLLNVVDKRKGY